MLLAVPPASASERRAISRPYECTFQCPAFLGCLMSEVAEALGCGLPGLHVWAAWLDSLLWKTLETHSDNTSTPDCTGHQKVVRRAQCIRQWLGLRLGVSIGCSSRHPDVLCRTSADVTLRARCAGNGGGGGGGGGEAPSLIRKQLGANNVGLYSGR